MSIFIKGVRMPKHCVECNFTYHDCESVEDLCMFHHEKTIADGARHPKCPLVEVKEPHGRLGDLDELKSKFRHGEGDDDVDSAWISAIRRFITQAETIIEAEGSE